MICTFSLYKKGLCTFLQVFNNEGEFILKFGSNGEGNGQFNAPTGVAVDINGNIIVADWGNSRIQVRPKSMEVRPRTGKCETLFLC